MTSLAPPGPAPTDVEPQQDRRRPAGSPAAEATGRASAQALGPTLLLVAVTCGTLIGFGRTFSGAAWAGPAFTAALVGHAIGWGGRRLRLPTAPAVVIGLAAVCLVGVWTVLGASTTYGLPLGRAWSAVHDALAEAGQVAPAVNPPVPELPGFRLLAAWGAGLVAVLADWAAFRLRTVLQAVAPAAAVFVVGAVLGRPSGRLVALVCFLGPVLAFVLVQRNTVGRVGTIWAGGRPRSAIPWTAGVAVGLAAVLASLATLPALAPANGRGVLGWKHGPGDGSSGARSVISPIVDLHARLVSESGQPVLTVTSPVASYWRLTSLDTFTGAQWQSTNSYYPVGQRLPGVGPAPAGTRQVVQQFHLEGLSSIWLPAAFNPEAVSGGGKVTWDPVSGSLLTAKATADGLDYQVTSLQYLATLDPRLLEAAPPPPTSGPFAQDVQLPPIDPEVRALAERITAGKRTEYDKALALQNFFYGPSFTYSLDPPSDGYGTDALINFLFNTRTGYCQQFAGSYAVLARSIGLPTRLAVGFTTGTPIGPDRYQVTDANAHTWPEVYFPRYGWLPFEPTKGGFQVPGARAYTGDTTAASGPAVDPTTPSPEDQAPAPTVLRHGAQPPSSATTTPVRRNPTGARARVTAPPSGGWTWVLWPVGIGAALLAAAGGGAWHRGRRRRRRAGLDARTRVLAAWADTEALLAWSGVRRDGGETATEVAVRATAALAPWTAGGAGADDGALAELPQLARWASEAGYGADDVSVEVATRAEAGVDRLTRVLVHANPWHRRLRRWADPRSV